jgi:hypothetical protein
MKTSRAFVAILMAMPLAWAACGDDDDEIVDGFDLPPGRVTDLTITTVTTNSITLKWTAPTDDGDVSEYELKQSDAVIDGGNFDAATTVPGVPAPATPGTIEIFTVNGLDSTLVYYFALRSRDDVGQISEVSNNASWSPPGTPIHSSKAIPSFKDNTLYEEVGLCASCPGTTGVLDSLSNGAGEWMFTGKNNIGDDRRALLAFAIADSLPAGATIDSVVLTLRMSKTQAGAVANALHRVLADWGEGPSDASCCGAEEGAGGSAMAGDATWLQRVFRTSGWTTPGGDFNVAASATRSVGGVGTYAWRSAQMAADVQGWLDTPANNFGWILIGDESAGMTAKRFDTRETTATRPILTVHYSVASP